jgi:hypothetical protein
MRLSAKQGYALLDKYGSFITKVCDACGKGIGPIRFTRRGDSGVWCSRECRGDLRLEDSHKGGRPRKYKNGEERRAAKTKQQRSYRLAVDVEKTSCSVAETKGLQAQKSLLSTTPHTPAVLHTSTC